MDTPAADQPDRGVIDEIDVDRALAPLWKLIEANCPQLLENETEYNAVLQSIRYAYTAGCRDGIAEMIDEQGRLLAALERGEIAGP
jgi:hypothetical protein